MAGSWLFITITPVTSTRNRCSLFRSYQQHSSSRHSYASSTLRRSCSCNQLPCSINRVRASTTEPKRKDSALTVDIFNFQLSSSLIPSSLRSFLFDPLTKKAVNVEENMVGRDRECNKVKVGEELRRANWVERIIELQRQWRQKQLKDEECSIQEASEDCDGNGAEDFCEVEYDDDAAEDKVEAESFRRLMSHVSWSDTELFAKLASLSNLAYVIPEIKANDQRRCYGLDFVTSSLTKKAEAAALKMKLDQDSTSVPLETSATTESGTEKRQNSRQNHLPHPSVAYDIAASAASYVQSRAKDLLSIGSEPQMEISDAVLHAKGKHQIEEEVGTPPGIHKSEMAAYVAASSMTAVVAADEKQKQEAARDLQSLHSSPCEWFVCDDSSIYTRCFVIQGSDSLASWQANLFFEPTNFEGTDVLVHRGIYEAAKGIYEQFMPEITQHLERFGDRAKLQFTGHSLGGSLSLLVHLMLLTREVVKPLSLLPVVTFGSPFVFCGGQKVLHKLGLDEDHVHCVIMHRDIVPRAFSCVYPNHVAQVLKRLNSTFRSHPCLNKNKLLYSPMGTIFILQPDEMSSPPHPLLPPGNALYALKNTQSANVASALRAFLNTPHPLETLSDPTAYGSEGTILRDHDSRNYLKAVNKVIRQHTRQDIRKARKQRNLLRQLLASKSPHTWSNDCTSEERLATKEPTTGV
ncbi:phospholipase A1 PLIP1, chloroplastic-like [Coffea arabica]|uniref:Phospholipase A1 PLIP1, chloroplastic-like n=1 Tax=Coffea arabica TaxID=13443 RepID=A0ABM4WZZ6_COFAR